MLLTYYLIILTYYLKHQIKLNNVASNCKTRFNDYYSILSFTFYVEILFNINKSNKQLYFILIY